MPGALHRRVTAVVVLVASGLAIAAAVAGLHRAEQLRAQQKAAEHLRLVALSKVAQIAEWREERIQDAIFLHNAPFVSHHVEALLADHNSPGGSASRAWLRSIKGGTRYAEIIVFDSALQPRLRIGDTAADAIGPALLQDVASMLREPVVRLTDIRQSGTERNAYLDLLCPVYAPRDRVNRPDGTFTPKAAPIAVIVLRILPDEFLFPLLKSWPEVTKTAEALLLQRAGNGVEFVNERRFKGSTGNQSAGEQSRLATAAIRDNVSVIESLDYRGERVLAAVVPVPGTAWIVETKVDYSELFAPVRDSLKSLLLTAIALWLAIGGAMGWYWHSRQAEHLRRQLEADAVRREFEERFRLIAATIDEVFWIGPSGAGSVTYVSPGYERIWGRSVESVLRDPSSFIAAIHHEDRPRVIAQIARQQTGEPFEHEYRVVRPDGTVRRVRDRGHPVRNAAGEVTQYVGVIEDITERAHTAEMLRRSEERYSYAARAISDIIWDWNLVTDEYWVSDGCETVLGYKAAELDRGAQLMPLVHPEDQARIASQLNEVLVGADTTCVLEYRFRRKDGSYAEIYDRGFVLRDESGQAIRMVGGMSDVTERKNLVAAISYRERQLNGFFSSATAGMALFSPDLRFLRVNETLAEMNGRSPAEHVGRTLAEVIPDVATSAATVMQRVLATGRSLQNIEFTATTPGQPGALRAWLASIFPIVDARGRAEAIGTVVVEITEQKRAERAREASERRFREMLENLNSIAMILDRDGKVAFCNDYLLRLTGWSRDEVLGADWFSQFIPSSRAVVRAAFESGMRDGSMPAHYENPILTRTGELRHINWSNTLLRDPAGEVIGTASVGQDMTAYRSTLQAMTESEERFRQLAENINEVFWMAEPGTDALLYVSPAYERVWGRSAASAYDGSCAWLEGVHTDDRARVRAAAAKKSTGQYNETYRIVRPDGAIRFVRDRAFPIRNASGEIFRVVGIAEDITEATQLEAQLRNTQKMEALGTLAGGIAHDFNNILATINGYTVLAQVSTEQGMTANEHFQEVMRASARAASLVRQILAFSRRGENTRVPLRLAAVVDEASKMLRATIPTSIEFAIDVGSGAPPVLADASQIHQVLMNLGVNAWHAMRGRNGRLTIKLARVEIDDALAAEQSNLSAGTYARITVSDTGHGMAPAVLERIFEPFFTTKAPGEGTGLGLAVVHGIIQSHGGIVTVTSEPGTGTTFQLYFPAILAEPAPPEPAAATAPQGQGQRLLVVDDEEPIARLTRMMLEQMGYTVESQVNPAAALEAVRNRPEDFDLVVTDLTMPGMTGIELATELTRVRPKLPIILTSGYSSELTEEAIHAAGVCEILPKPASPEALGSMIQRLLAPH